jgi:phage replication O-like protein O
VSKIREPNYTQIPNVFLDEIMIGMSKAQLLVMLAVCRQTFGWHRASCQLSLSDLQKLTGLGRQSVKNGIDELISAGYIKREKVGRSFAYSLVISPEESKNETINDQSKNETDKSPKTGLQTVQKRDRSRHSIKEKKKENLKKEESSTDNDSLLRSKPEPSPGEKYWITAYGDLQLQLPRETFNTWLRNAKLLSCEDGVFTIGVDNQYAVEWLKHRLHKVVSDTLRRIVEKEVSVNYVLLPNGAGQGV